MRKALNKFGFQFWLVFRQLNSGGKFLNLTTALSFIGMVIGVASLVISMAVVSGFETTLRSSVIDFTGHLMLLKAGDTIQAPAELLPRLRKIAPSIVSYAPFVQVEALVAHRSKTSGITLLGLEPETASEVVDLDRRIHDGTMNLEKSNGVPTAVIGRGLSKKFELKIGDRFQVVAPRPSKVSQTSFSPKPLTLIVSGIVDLGKYDYDSRFILIHADSAMELRGGGKGYTGLRLKLTDADLAEEVRNQLDQELGHPYWTKSWFDVSRNLFEAIRIEKIVIMLIVLMMVVTASFNICSTLFVNVLKRYTEISIMKTIGASPKFIQRIFSLHGLVIGLAGSLVGIALGVVLALYLPTTALFQIPGEVYKLEQLKSDIRWSDLIVILTSSMLICFFSTFAPAIKGSKLKPVEGLRYE